MYLYVIAHAQKRKAGAKKTGSADQSSESNERLQAARDKRAAQRNRLKEMKLAAKRAREQEVSDSSESAQSQEEPLPVAPSPKKNKIGEYIAAFLAL